MTQIQQLSIVLALAAMDSCACVSALIRKSEYSGMVALDGSMEISQGSLDPTPMQTSNLVHSMHVGTNGDVELSKNSRTKSTPAAGPQVSIRSIAVREEIAQQFGSVAMPTTKQVLTSFGLGKIEDSERTLRTQENSQEAVVDVLGSFVDSASEYSRDSLQVATQQISKNGSADVNGNIDGKPQPSLAHGGEQQNNMEVGAGGMDPGLKQAGSSRVVYADMACNEPKHQALLSAQMETWAAGPLSEGRFYAVIGEGNSSINTEFQKALVKTPCEDSYQGLACKEFFLEKEALDRQVDWLAILGDDNYIDASKLEQKLSRVDPLGQLGPTALGIVGCKLYNCPELPNAVSICGGGGLFLNRAAINLLFADGAAALYAEYSGKKGWPNDVMTACALQRRGGKLMDYRSGLIGNRILKSDERQNIISHPDTALMHYLTTPAVMRWTHAVRLGHWAEAMALKESAFVEDCCCWYTDAAECKDAPKPNSLIDGTSENLFDWFARLHIAEMLKAEHVARLF